MSLYERKPARLLSSKRRHGTHFKLTANDQVIIHKSQRLIVSLFAFQRKFPKSIQVKKALKICLIRHIYLKYTPNVSLEPSLSNRRRDIDSYSPAECESLFRFKKEDMKRLCRLLKFPYDENMIMDNGLSFPGEEVFLRGLYELVGGEAKHRVAREFGRDHTSQSRAFDAFIDHVYDKFHHLVRETKFILF